MKNSTTDAVRLWLTKDHDGTNLWRHRPKFCFANNLYFNGGETLTLAEGAFADLHIGACVEVEVRRVNCVDSNGSVCVWLTKDRASINLWQRQPRIRFSNNLYFGNSETMTLAKDAFPTLRMGSCVLVAVRQAEES